MTEEQIKIDLPKISEEEKYEAIDYYLKNHQPLSEILEKTSYPDYLPWEKVKRKTWIPKDITPEQFWIIVKMQQRPGRFKSPVKDPDGKYFTWNSFPHYDRLLHKIDLNTGGLLIDLDLLTDAEKKTYKSRGIIEEAIASAQLEGAHTTREVAKKMIEEGHAPKDRSQRMIMNNYHAMQIIEERAKARAFDIDTLIELHYILTDGTLDNPDQVGRFRHDNENIVVGPEYGPVAYIPPKMAFVKEQLGLLIDYMNDELDEKNRFTHPVIKAIILHFWLCFLHPFADGNGRLARALFYWYMLKNKYWAFSFIPLSTKIKESPVQYGKAYLWTEQDGYDLTYFIDYNLNKIELAQKDFIDYTKKKAAEYLGFEKLEKAMPDLNHRQLNLLKFLYACPEERTNVSSMVNIHGISAGTAISDLQGLVDKNFLVKKRAGKNMFYYPTSDMLETLQTILKTGH